MYGIRRTLRKPEGESTMLAFEEETCVARGQKSARMEQRTTVEAKEIIDRAARLLGVNSSEFVVTVAARVARETIRDYEQTKLTAPDHEAFLRAFEATEPTPMLVSLMKLHNEVSKPK